jgi:predicted AAA+ superfamily ATPase
MATQHIHKRLEPRLYFFIDSARNEVDLLCPNGSQYIPIEIKLGETINKNWVRGINTGTKLINPMSIHGLVVYCGGERQMRTEATFLNPASLENEF